MSIRSDLERLLALSWQGGGPTVDEILAITNGKDEFYSRREYGRIVGRTNQLRLSDLRKVLADFDQVKNELPVLDDPEFVFTPGGGPYGWYMNPLS